ncbi:hypothetical protein A3C18_02630 [Candidatus Kaiserbacteria bacterium RIFCSPHIGHO2_02_FULL_54_11b]|uniref:DNA replication/recombination mediator RecO N-terminal domain-containing protein n=2 Tax=Candidatus Kaiseribacteriota TaxID=1752734 RepID=A0A1F6CKL5_9BACT|nr:MAG: hypothetical protein A2704_07120 [Candidatus Kaiserbacteria bacterium RIFCSPHIGHO2_01_FULL_54_36b]OGG64375.1 MAG: hypothetical protein A3C18_02630 [Candidatus Kaiserbacteria bacterium RIFCSPHIGHO2_02_FULL_54_11b]
MYQKYHTEALVLGNRELGEADRMVALFTRDFGLVRARASAIRTEHSKMRYSVQDYSRARVSLVKGRRGWRLAGAAALKLVAGDRKSISAFARIAELTIRLVHGEEKNDYLFAVLSEAHDALMREKVEAGATIEIVCVARVLYALGYLSAEALETALFTHTAFDREHVLEAEAKRDEILASINRAIAETHL